MECSKETYQRSRLNFGHWQVPLHRAAYSKHLTDFSRRNVMHPTWNLSPFPRWSILLAFLKLWKEEDLCMAKKMKYTITAYVRTLRGAKGTKLHLLHEPKSDRWRRKSVETVNPQIFRVGDIVEAQVSFIAVPLKDKKYKMITVLRSIALLDSTFSQVRSLSGIHPSFSLMNMSMLRRCRRHWKIECANPNLHNEPWPWKDG